MLLERLDPRAPGTPHVARFAAGEPPRSVAEALRHQRLEQTLPVCLPGHTDTLLRHLQAAKKEA